MPWYQSPLKKSCRKTLFGKRNLGIRAGVDEGSTGLTGHCSVGGHQGQVDHGGGRVKLEPDFVVSEVACLVESIAGPAVPPPPRAFDGTRQRLHFVA